MSYKTKEEIDRLNEPLLRQNKEDLAKELEINWSEFYKRTVSSPEAYKSENGKTLQNIVFRGYIWTVASYFICKQKC